MIKILYFSINNKNTNPSYNLYKNIFHKNFDCLLIDVCNFLPSKFNSQIKKKIIKFSSDIILIDYQLLDYKENKEFIVGFNELAYSNCLKFLNSYLRLNKLPLVVFCDQDFYKVTMSSIKNLSFYNCYLISPDYKFFPEKKKINPKEEIYYNKLTDHWRTYVKKKYRKIISCPHIIANNEFYKFNTKKKNIDVSILGAQYFYRRNAKKILIEAGINVKTFRPFTKLCTILLKLLRKNIFIYFRKIIILYYNNFFFNVLQKSNISITCGGVHKYIVRKYLEISAHGCLPVVRKCQNYKNFGFKDNKNIVFADEDDLVKKVSFFLKKKKLSAKIVKSSQKFLFENHSETARTKQLKRCFALIIKKQFKGSMWLNGKFKLLQ